MSFYHTRIVINDFYTVEWQLLDLFNNLAVKFAKVLFIWVKRLLKILRNRQANSRYSASSWLPETTTSWYRMAIHCSVNMTITTHPSRR
jgi:hypothetical protein